MLCREGLGDNRKYPIVMKKNDGNNSKELYTSVLSFQKNYAYFQDPRKVR